MFKIDAAANSITSLTLRTFGELGFSERKNLQEWIAKEPSCLGEELLIIQKEFSGFSDTHERLDILALDKQGSLVLIENKLDDTGRDVTWQALKYALYCSRLSKENVLSIYQEFLAKTEPSADARALASPLWSERLFVGRVLFADYLPVDHLFVSGRLWCGLYRQGSCCLQFRC